MGGWGVGLLMLLENVFPPIPSEVVMPFAGFLAANGTLSFFAVIIAGTLGSLIGAYLWYAVGLRLGEARLRRLIEKYGRWLTISLSDLDRALIWFRKHDGPAVLLGRMIPGVRTLISVPAGLTGMPRRQFLFYTALGSLIWTTALALSGYILEAQFDRVQAWLNPITNALLLFLLAIYVWRLIRPKSVR